MYKLLDGIYIEKSAAPSVAGFFTKLKPAVSPAAQHASHVGTMSGKLQTPGLTNLIKPKYTTAPPQKRLPPVGSSGPVAAPQDTLPVAQQKPARQVGLAGRMGSLNWLRGTTGLGGPF